MKTKYNIEFESRVVENELSYLTNQIYKLLPCREEGSDWSKPLETVMIEIIGMKDLLIECPQELMLRLLSKLEGLYSLKAEKDFFIFRRTIFDCLNLLNEVYKKCQITVIQ